MRYWDSDYCVTKERIYTNTCCKVQMLTNIHAASEIRNHDRNVTAPLKLDLTGCFFIHFIQSECKVSPVLN
jgi:hypothetical protein